MGLRGEGQSRTEDPSTRVDAISRTILDEKDPMIRGHLENLRSQIAAIAARHGANARDVWNKEVQDRMSLDEMDRVNALFAAIRRAGEKKMSSADVREIGTELDGTEAEARKMLEDALERLWEVSGGREDVVKMFMRAGMVGEATEFAMDHVGEFPDTDESLWARLSMMRAAEYSTKSFRDARLELTDQMEQIAVLPTSNLKINRILAPVYDAYLSYCTDEEILAEPRHLALVRVTHQSPTVERLVLEFRKRKLPESLPALVKLCDQTDQKRAGWFTPVIKVGFLLSKAETFQANGLDPSDLLREAMQILQTTGSDREEKRRALEANLVVEIPRTFAKTGMIDLWKQLRGSTYMSFRYDAVDLAEGRMDAKDFNGALAYLDSDGLRFADRDKGVFHLIQALIDADKTDEAERVYHKFIPNDGSSAFDIPLAKTAARARRGENVLAEARREAAAIETHDEFDTRQLFVRLILANAAIATIGYTEDMKKRLATYDAKR